MFATRMISIAAGSGIVLGALAGAMIPTTMRQAPREWWRGQIELHASPKRTSYHFVEAGPQDLDPHGTPQPEIRALARRLAERTAMAGPIYQPTGHEGFTIEPPASLPVPEEVTALRAEPEAEATDRTGLLP